MKEKLLVLSLVAIMAATIATGTLAFTVRDVKAHNVITTGNVKIALQEWADPDRTVPYGDAHKDNAVTGVVADNAFTKVVDIRNTGSSDAWVRATVDMTLTAADGETPLDPSVVSLDLNTEKWAYLDGYYYYKDMLPAADDPETGDVQENVTAPLFTTVRFDKAMGNDYQGCQVAVNVSAMAVQYKNNGDQPGETFLDAAGWPEPRT